MHIAFLSSLDPTDIHSWSGTLYFIYQTLRERHKLTWLGGGLIQQIASNHVDGEGRNSIFYPEDYSQLFGAILSEQLRRDYYDLIICRDYFFLADLVTDLPILYLGDTTFRLFQGYLGITDPHIMNRNDQLERRAIDRATHIIYPSDWAKQSAINHYGKEEDRISVIEFGANLMLPPQVSQRSFSGNTCHLLFVGTNWHKKGGEHVLSVYHRLRELGVNASLTIVGCQPPQPLPKGMQARVIPYLDKATEEGQRLFDQLFRESDFLLAPTSFDCFGIVYCEAAAYGVPVLTTDVGGVKHVVRHGINGFLFPPEASVEEWVQRIMQLYTEPISYRQISQQALSEYQNRLCWKSWGIRMEHLLQEICPMPEVYIPVYVINMKEREDRRRHICREFEGRTEFEVHLIEACTSTCGRRGLWQSIVKVIQMAKEAEEDIIIICEDDHFFTEQYTARLLISQIQRAYQLGADLLSGGIGGFGRAIPRGSGLYEVDWLWCTQFIVIYPPLFDRILTYNFTDDDTADGVLSQLALHKMVTFPFISEQRDFGYSDVTESNQEHVGRIREHFAWASRALASIRARVG